MIRAFFVESFRKEELFLQEQYKELLRNLGYDVSLTGAAYFIELIDEVRTLFREGKSEEEIRELLPRYYLEYYHFILEVGGVKYMKELKKFSESRRVKKAKNEFLEQSMLFSEAITIEDNLLSICKYLNLLDGDIITEVSDKVENKQFVLNCGIGG